MTGFRSEFLKSLVSLDEVADRFALDKDGLKELTARYPFRLTRYYFNLIKEVGDPLWLQAIPDVRELDDGQLDDPLAENTLSPVPGLIHRYPDRVVWLVSNECALYCRFCMRKRRVGRPVPPAMTEEAIACIAANPAISDVILSGGDPLLLDDDRLEDILRRLRQIPHVSIIRIGSRLPVTYPARITAELAAMLKKYQPIYINTHFNHPAEITAESAKACAILADAGIVLGNQTVLLKGVNDSASVMQQLCKALLAIRVKPYYLHQMDLVRGTGHLRTSVRAALQIMDSLRGNISGLGVPYYVIDLPGGKGKVPLLPGHVIGEDGVILLKNYLGETFEYRDVEE